MTGTKIDPVAFATAVINSSSPDLTVGEKLELYIQAQELATNHNKDVIKKKNDGFYSHSN